MAKMIRSGKSMAANPSLRMQFVSHEVYEERQRCMEIIRAYRRKLEIIETARYQHMLKAAGKDIFADIRDAVVISLKGLENDISSGKELAVKNSVPAGSLSLDELEEAKSLIDKIDPNPFEA